tara:strand:- start:283 stop:453 length:171 start_codon:yes stop_codon:yes gene_type:complete
MDIINNMAAVSICVTLGLFIGTYGMFILMFSNEQSILKELDIKSQKLQEYEKKETK